MNEVYIVLTPLSSSESERVRFSEDLIGESGLDLDCLSCISAWISATISSLALPMFARPVSKFVVHSFAVRCVLSVRLDFFL